MLRFSKRSASTRRSQRPMFCWPLSSLRSRPDQKKGPLSQTERPLRVPTFSLCGLADLVNLCPAVGACADCCRLAVLHRDRLRVCHLNLSFVLQAVAFHYVTVLIRDSVGGGPAHSRGGYLGKTTPIRAEFRQLGRQGREKRARKRSQKGVLPPHRKEQSEPPSLANLDLTHPSGIPPSRAHIHRLQIPRCLCRPRALRWSRRRVGERVETHVASKTRARPSSCVRRETCSLRESRNERTNFQLP